MDGLEVIFNIADKYGWNVILVALAIYILFKGTAMIAPQIKNKGLGPYTFKALGLVLLLPVILVLGGGEAIPGEVLSTLLGALAGYIFGIEKGNNGN